MAEITSPLVSIESLSTNNDINTSPLQKHLRGFLSKMAKTPSSDVPVASSSLPGEDETIPKSTYQTLAKSLESCRSTSGANSESSTVNARIKSKETTFTGWKQSQKRCFHWEKGNQWEYVLAGRT
jgi:hypothetical protein